MCIQSVDWAAVADEAKTAYEVSKQAVLDTADKTADLAIAANAELQKVNWTEVSEQAKEAYRFSQEAAVSTVQTYRDVEQHLQSVNWTEVRLTPPPSPPP